MKKRLYLSVAVLLLVAGCMAVLGGPLLMLSRYPVEPLPNLPTGCEVRGGLTSSDVLPKTVPPVGAGVASIFAGVYVLRLSQRGRA